MKERQMHQRGNELNAHTAVAVEDAGDHARRSDEDVAKLKRYDLPTSGRRLPAHSFKYLLGR